MKGFRKLRRWIRRRTERRSQFLPDTPPTQSTTPDAVADNAAVISSSGLFDPLWYLEHNRDVAAAGVDPVRHYVIHGAAEGRNPGPEFNTSFYLEQNPDVAASTFNPLVHYIQHGHSEGRLAYPGSSHANRWHLSPFASNSRLRYSIFGLAELTEYLQADATPLELAARPSPDAYSPLISLIIPVYNTPPRFLREVIQSIRAQVYGHWEICIVDDCSSDDETLAILQEIGRMPQVKTARMDVNSGIAKASQAALEMASGEYVGFVDHDDILTPNALSEMVALLRNDPSLDYIYSDHAMADARGLPRSFARKPAWSPEFLLSTNYIVHFKLVRRQLLLDGDGLEHEVSNVQDLGMSLRLLEARVKVAHLPKILYLWRDHARSVASSSAAKPGIEGLIVDAYNEHARRQQRNVRHYHPKHFQAQRIGVFATDFSQETTRTALVIICDDVRDIAASKERSTPLLRGHVQPYWVTFAAGSGAANLIRLPDRVAVRHFLSSINEPYVVVMRSSARCVSPAGLSDLTGYLSMDDAIGLVGGKVLDDHLRVQAGGMLLDRLARYRVICKGQFDNEAGHWFIGQAASNVDAVTGLCFAARRTTLLDAPGIDFHRFGDFADVHLSQQLRAAGLRVVYNPAMKAYDPSGLGANPAGLDAIASRARSLLTTRMLCEL